MAPFKPSQILNDPDFKRLEQADPERARRIRTGIITKIGATSNSDTHRRQRAIILGKEDWKPNQEHTADDERGNPSLGSRITNAIVSGTKQTFQGNVLRATGQGDVFPETYPVQGGVEGAIESVFKVGGDALNLIPGAQVQKGRMLAGGLLAGGTTAAQGGADSAFRQQAETGKIDWGQVGQDAAISGGLGLGLGLAGGYLARGLKPTQQPPVKPINMAEVNSKVPPTAPPPGASFIEAPGVSRLDGLAPDLTSPIGAPPPRPQTSFLEMDTPPLRQSADPLADAVGDMTAQGRRATPDQFLEMGEPKPVEYSPLGGAQKELFDAGFRDMDDIKFLASDINDFGLDEIRRMADSGNEFAAKQLQQAEKLLGLSPDAQRMAGITNPAIKEAAQPITAPPKKGRYSDAWKQSIKEARNEHSAATAQLEIALNRSPQAFVNGKWVDLSTWKGRLQKMSAPQLRAVADGMTQSDESNEFRNAIDRLIVARETIDDLKSGKYEVDGQIVTRDEWEWTPSKAEAETPAPTQPEAIEFPIGGPKHQTPPAPEPIAPPTAPLSENAPTIKPTVEPKPSVLSKSWTRNDTGRGGYFNESSAKSFARKKQVEADAQGTGARYEVKPTHRNQKTGEMQYAVYEYKGQDATPPAIRPDAPPPAAEPPVPTRIGTDQPALSENPVAAKMPEAEPAPRPEVEAPKPAAPDAQPAPKPTSQAADNLPLDKEEEFFNFRRAGLSDKEDANLRRIVREEVAAKGLDPKQRVTFEQIKQEAAEIDPEMLKHVRPPKDGETLNPAVRVALRNRLNALNSENAEAIRALEQGRNTLTPEQVQRLEGIAAQTERDAKKILETLIPTRTQDGRNLAYHRIMAENSFDVDYWMNRARRLAGGDLTKAQEARLKAILARGQAAMEGKTLPDVPMSPSKNGMQAITKAIKQTIDAQADAARKRIHERGPRLMSGLDVDTAADLAVIGASKIAKGLVNFTEWSAEMAQEFGKAIQPHLKKLFTKSQKIHDGARNEAMTPANMRRLLGNDKGNWEAPGVKDARMALAKEFMRLERSNLLETITTARKSWLLTAPKTSGLNLTSNALYRIIEEFERVPGAMTDIALSLLTKQRVLEGPRFDALVRGSRKAALDGVIEAGKAIAKGDFKSIGAALQKSEGLKQFWQTMTQGATDADLALFNIHREVNTGSKVLDATINGPLRFQGAQDKLTRVYQISRSLEEQSRMMAKTMATKGEIPRNRAAVNQKAAELLANPDEGMMAMAVADAEEATFMAQNGLSKAINQIKGKPGTVKHAAMEVFGGTTFVNVPTNIILNVLDRIPGMGLARGVLSDRVRTVGDQFTKGNRSEAIKTLTKAISPQEQRVIARTVGRQISGGLMGILTGYMLAAKGVMTGTYDEENKGGRDRDEAYGRKPMSVKIGDKWYEIGRIAPYGTLMVVGATLYREGNKNLADDSKRVGKMLTSATDVVLEQPVMKGVKDVYDALQDPESKGLRYVSGVAGSFVPSIANVIGEDMDTVKRDAKAKDLPDAIVKGVSARVPGLRQTLPPKLDTFGDKVPANDEPWWSPNFLNPKEAKEENDPVAREAVRLNVGINKPDRRIDVTVRGIKQAAELTQDEYQQMLQVAGDKIQRVLARRVDAPMWDRLSDEKKTEIMKNAIRSARSDATGQIKAQVQRRIRNAPPVRP